MLTPKKAPGRKPPNDYNSPWPSKLPRPYVRMVPLGTSVGLICPSVFPDVHMVVAHPARFPVFNMGPRIRKKVKNILVRPVIGPLNERGSSRGVKNWPQIKNLPPRSQPTSQKARLSRYVGACGCGLNLKLAVIYLVYEENGGPINQTPILSAPWCLSEQSIMHRFGLGAPCCIRIYHSQYAPGLWAMWLIAHVSEFWYFLYTFCGSDTGFGELSTRQID